VIGDKRRVVLLIATEKTQPPNHQGFAFARLEVELQGLSSGFAERYFAILEIDIRRSNFI
jgi:hypothetical protein